MRRPLIGIPGRRRPTGDIAGTASSLAHLPIDLYPADYARSVVAAGGVPLHLPLDLAPDDAVEVVDGIVLTGGADVDPCRYGAVAETDELPPEAIRDEFELGVLDAAERLGVPVLGICRGLQLVNVWRGGTLHQDVPAHSRYDLGPIAEVHTVEFAAGSVLGALHGRRRTVNSLHHQTVDRLGDGLVVTGRADDGVVEGIESDDGRVLAVQWHPEMLAADRDEPVFGWIVGAAGAEGDGIGRAP